MNIARLGINGTEYWTSGRYSPADQRWHWMATGQPIIFNNWFPGQPDANNTDSAILLYYLTDRRGLWADNIWIHGIPYICEAKLLQKSPDPIAFNIKNEK